MDSALENALRQRDILAALLSELQNEIAEKQRNLAKSRLEIERINKFISEWYGFAGVPMPESEILPTPIAAHSSATEYDAGAIPQPKRPKNPKKEDVARWAYDMIEDNGGPMSRSDLYKQLVASGVVLNGTDPEMVLSTMLWRMSKVIVRTKGGYWMADKPNKEFGYDPATATKFDNTLNIPINEIRSPVDSLFDPEDFKLEDGSDPDIDETAEFDTDELDEDGNAKGHHYYKDGGE